MSLEHLPALLRVTQGVLARKVLVFVALIMTFALFCYAMYRGEWIYLAIAASFAVVVFLPVLIRKEPSDVA